MSKIIVINGADFSENACDVVNMFTHEITDYDEFFASKKTHYIDANGIWHTGDDNFNISFPLEGTKIQIDATENCSTFGDWSDTPAGEAIIAFFSEIPRNEPGQAAAGLIGEIITVEGKVTMDIPVGTKYLYVYAAYCSNPPAFTSYLPKAIYWK